jgi:hypothetical protein
LDRKQIGIEKSQRKKLNDWIICGASLLNADTQYVLGSLALM